MPEATVLNEIESGMAVRYQLQAKQAKILALLLIEKLASQNKLLDICNSWGSLKVAIHHLRKAMAPHGCEIYTVHRVGYFIDGAAKRRLRKELELHDDVTTAQERLDEIKENPDKLIEVGLNDALGEG